MTHLRCSFIISNKQNPFIFPFEKGKKSIEPPFLNPVFGFSLDNFISWIHTNRIFLYQFVVVLCYCSSDNNRGDNPSILYCLKNQHKNQNLGSNSNIFMDNRTIFVNKKTSSIICQSKETCAVTIYEI